MSWIEIMLVTGAFVGFVSMGALVARSPSFWLSMGVAGIKAALPLLLKLLKPASPEEQKVFRESVARGEEYVTPFDRKRKKTK